MPDLDSHGHAGAFCFRGTSLFPSGCQPPKERTSKYQEMSAAKGLGPIRVLSALAMSDPSHDPSLHAHVGRHADILATVTRRWLEQRFLPDLVRTVTGAIREAAEGGHRYVTIVFYCKSGQHRSVAAVELASVLFMHVPGLVVLVDHLNAPEWKFKSCLGQCLACRQRPLQNPDATPALTKLYAEFVKVWNWRGGSGLDPILGNLPAPLGGMQVCDQAKTRPFRGGMSMLLLRPTFRTSRNSVVVVPFRWS